MKINPPVQDSPNDFMATPPTQATMTALMARSPILLDAPLDLSYEGDAEAVLAW